MIRRVRWILSAIACMSLAACGVEDRASLPTDEPGETIERLEPQMDDATYLYRLGLMRGHLLVGNALFEIGEQAAAGTHSKHPTDELYEPMETEFAARGSGGFAAELQAHAEAVARRDQADVQSRYAELISAIAENEDVVDFSPALVAEVIARLVREAAQEYAIGIVDGVPANAHEYQDAYGFTQVAGLWAQRAAADHPGHESVFGRIREAIDGVSDMWPALLPPAEVSHKASRLYGVAADIEIIALDLPR
ncbi:MAG: hypothetical protein OXP36_12175 [Gammaproteobacteria bacterium]|nr:hypothetical protein [Gammaproteobacteria bacterium]